jgi:lysophospholipase L1-like esterase
MLMNPPKKSIVAFIALLLSLGLAASPSRAQVTGPAAGQKVAFMGDSITQFGEGPTGYVTLAAQALEANGRKIVVIPAGVSGNTSKDMLARLDRDVLSKKPDWMTLSCGVNDVWHGANGCTLDEYQKNITSIIDQATAAGIKVVILTATMIQEDQTNALNKKLVDYNQFLHTLATEKHFPIADLNADMQAELAAQKAATPNLKGNILTVDGVHMNGLGDEMMAAGILKAFGFTDAQLAQARDMWLDLPNGMAITPRAALTVRQYLQLEDLAAGQGKSVNDLFNDALAKDVQTLLISASANGTNSTAPAKPSP